MTAPRSTYTLPGARETHMVEIVDPAGTPIGTTTVAESHTIPGRLHRAFSVLLTDGRGTLLIQQRAATKTRFALRWGNTCCGHPEPGQDVHTAASERLYQEMGLLVHDLEEAGRFVYRAEDPVSGRVEHEYDHVLVGTVAPGTVPQPDHGEVADWRWVTRDRLREDVERHPDRFAPWLADVVRLAGA